MTHIIVLRFSAMGDVLMTVPVIDSLARQYPDVRITVVSRPWAKPIFELLPKNVKFVGVDLHGEYAFSAKFLTNDFINDNIYLQNKTLCILHGIGEGILK